MRATINFEIEVDRVNNVMAELVATQVEYLISAADLIRKDAVPSNLLEILSESLEKIERETAQLKQYRDMLASFEKARFETLLPQPAPSGGDPVQSMSQIKQAASSMRQFDKFVSRMNEETPDDTGPEEG